MKIVLISDTHGFTNELNIPDGDLLIHAGDFSRGRGGLEATNSFLNWFGNLPHKHKVFIAGNHDFFVEKHYPEFLLMLDNNKYTYLHDSSCTIEGLKIHGSPISPWFCDWAFNRERGKEIQEHWDKIPNDTDILITHGPPYNILDKTFRGEAVGCMDLYATVKEVKPKIHVFGHIHEGYGIHEDADTKYINASVLNLRYKIANKPIVLDI